MSASIPNAILLIEFLETGRRYDRAEAMKKFHMIINERHGSHVSVAGSRIICTFADASTAAGAACELMACSFPGKSPLHPVARMCVSQFPDKPDSREAHASAIATAAREVVKANPGQIVATQDTAGRLSDEFEIRLNSSGGNSGKSVFEVVLASDESDDATRVVSPAERARASAGEAAGKQIHLRWRGKDQTRQEIVLNRLRPVATFGREGSNDIVIDSGAASRQHGKIECSRDSVVIIDQSTNGTYVFATGGENFFLHRDKKLLPQRGHISLGERLGAEHPAVIQFIAGFSVG